MTNFKAGDKVVCVDASASITGVKILLAGAVYVVRDVTHLDGGLNVGVPDLDGWMFWKHTRFLKLITRTEREQMEVERKMPLTIKESVERGLLVSVKPVEIKLL